MAGSISLLHEAVRLEANREHFVSESLELRDDSQDCVQATYS